jgi:glutathione-regulated potassium-efflux system protein KefB
MPDGRVNFVIETFKESDERRLYGDYMHYTDDEKIRIQALKQSQELEEIFAQDVAEESVKDDTASAKKSARRK